LPVTRSFVFSIDSIQAGLARHVPTTYQVGRDTRQAAVALILRPRPTGSGGETDILFIRRAEKDGDPWSGHMAFPGGHLDTDDESLIEAATRETQEEIGLDLSNTAMRVGGLDQQRAMPRDRTLNMLIAPFVFALHHEPAFRPNHEVAEVVWTPLEPMAYGTNHTHEERIISGTPTRFGGYRINGGHFVWGLTYRVMQTLFEALDDSWVAP